MNSILNLVAWVTGDDSLDTEVVSGADWSELTRLIARLPSFWPIYRGFNQGTKERFWYSCVIVSHLRAYYSIFGLKDWFEDLMYELCDHMEKKWVWNPKSGGMVSAIGNEFVLYMNQKSPERKIWNTRIVDGSSVFMGCVKRNIPVITAYFTGNQYSTAKADGEISEEETTWLWKWTYGHCVCFTGINPREIQDNYEGKSGNTYKVKNWRLLKEKTWQKNCFFVILPQDVVPVPPNLRHKYA